MLTPGQEESFSKDIEREDIRLNVDLDSILVNELGQFGNFQLRLMVSCLIAAIFSAWAAEEYLFTTARLNSRCLIPECDTSPPELDPLWLHNAIPGTPGAHDNCQRFVRNYSQLSIDQNCPAALFDQNRVESCVEYVYENTNSIVYDFGLACDEWRRTLIGSLSSSGTVLALPITGYISDRWGRRTALAISGFNCAWLGASRYFANTYIGFIISEVAESTIGTGIYTSAYILLIEVMVPNYRPAASAAVSTFWALGRVTLDLIAWAVPDWRNLTLALYIPQFLTIAYYWVVPESVRWYMTKGRYNEAEKILQKIAKVNGKTLSQRSLEALRTTTEKRNHKQEIEKNIVNEPWLIVLVLRHKKVLLRCVLAPVWWITYSFIYYGLTINALNLSGNPYQSYMAVSLVEIPGLWIAVFLVNRIGRKLVLSGAFWMCAACQVTYIFVPHDYYVLSLAVYLFGACSIAMVTSSLYTYTAELYPTKHRHTLFAFTSMLGKIGTIVAPLTPAFSASTFEEFPFVLFGSFALLSGILMFLTPETLGTKLPDTMEDAENLEMKNSEDKI